jgi:inositol-phosphate phosphatase/L-galactose 1-phosphate phosphatase/histidinol-phosphatase
VSAACPAAFVELAHRLADASGAIIRRHFRSGIAVETKPDRSPVTAADREAEQAIRRLLAEAVPEHGVIGEEFPAEREAADHVWVIDPIDGTKAFITGKPLFGTLIALLERGRPILGVVDHPALGERWIGAAGQPTLLNGKPVTTRACAGLGAAALYASSPDMFTGEDWTRFRQVKERVRFAGWGSDCYAYGLLASGHVDLVVEADMGPHDYLALVAVVEGAGGRITDWQGRPLGLRSDGRVVAAGDARTHAEALALLGR